MITRDTDRPMTKLLQHGDLVAHAAGMGTVTGIDLTDNDDEQGPLFVVTLEATGEEIAVRSRECRILVPSPARALL